MTRLSLTLILAFGAGPAGLAAQRSQQFYYPGSFNYRFLERYPDAARLFNAFDYGHAVLYETLWAEPAGAAERLEGRELRFLTEDLLRHPPRFAIVEDAVAPRYRRALWRASQMFDWAHLLHRQIYDAYADDRLTPAAQAALVERLTDYYLSNRALAFADRPKDMALMDDQYYSKVFRTQYPKFNGLIWAYHWLQVGLYEPLVADRPVAERRANVAATVARFWTLIDSVPRASPSVMPMTPAVAPRFTARHPRAAAIFDNLHMMHDIISDVLASPKVPHREKIAVIEAALTEFQDPTRHLMADEHWRMMGEMMGGVERMGGRPIGAGPGVR